VYKGGTGQLKPKVINEDMLESDIETSKEVNNSFATPKSGKDESEVIEKRSAIRMFVKLNDILIPNKVNIEEEGYEIRHKEEVSVDIRRETSNDLIKENIIEIEEIEVDPLDTKKQDEVNITEAKQELQSTGISLKEAIRNGSMNRASSVLLSFDINSSSSPLLSLADAFRRQKKNIIQRAERKQSMKSEPKSRQKALQPKRTLRRLTSKSKSSLNSELVDRLVAGKRIKIMKEEMRMRTERRYQQLPEVVKKREQEKRRQEMLERIRLAKINRKVILAK